MKQVMNWRQLMSPMRFKVGEGGEILSIAPKTETPYRTPYHTDYDRVVFSNAFRRLGRKTQVHPLAKNDHTHNRLTHSVEVASVGRSLGNMAGEMLRAQSLLPEKISPNDLAVVVQTACLAHDIGNPPFGHTGEEALRDWFRQPENTRYLEMLEPAERRDIETCEGNAHSLRQTAGIEMYGSRGGMRLTAAAYGALLKYPWTSSSPQGIRKFNIYQTELPLMRRIAEELGLPEIAENHWARHPLSYLMEAADDICYALMDLEDAVGLELLRHEEIAEILAPLVSADDVQRAASPRERTAMMRGIAIGKAIDGIAQTFVAHQQELLNGTFPAKDLISHSSEAVGTALQQAKMLARERIFSHRSKVVHELASFSCIGLLLDVLIPAAHEYMVSGSLKKRHRLALNLLDNNPITQEDSLYLAYMKILDFVGGMTDNYAAQTAQELSGVSMM